jgi:hypothetical protein
MRRNGEGYFGATGAGAGGVDVTGSIFSNNTAEIPQRRVTPRRIFSAVSYFTSPSIGDCEIIESGWRQTPLESNVWTLRKWIQSMHRFIYYSSHHTNMLQNYPGTVLR